MAAEFSIKRLASGGVMTNYHCVSRCGHCLYNSSPARAKDFLGNPLAGKIFRRIKELGCRSVHIGGGEPLLDPPKLTDVVSAAMSAGVRIDYIETNSAWYGDPEQAAAVLKDLLAAGARTLLVSISPFHNAHIPFARVKGVIEACRRVGMQVFPWIDAFRADLGRLDARQTHGMDEFEAALGPNYLQSLPGRYWIHLGGRALRTFRSVYPLYKAAHLLKKSPSSCAQALSDTSHFHIDLYGNYIPGLCAGLAIDMEDIGRPLPAGKYPLLESLASTGIRGLYHLAGRIYAYTPQRGAFLNHCDLCTDIRNYLVRLKGEQFRELAPEGFYAELGLE